MASKAKQSPQKESPRSKRQREEDISDDPKALFDQPLVIEGKRKRKSTEMFSFGAPQADRPQQAVEVGHFDITINSVMLCYHYFSITVEKELNLVTLI
jgi:hypothetical protein